MIFGGKSSSKQKINIDNSVTTRTSTSTRVGDIGFTGAQAVDAIQASQILGVSALEHSFGAIEKQSLAFANAVQRQGPSDQSVRKGVGEHLPLIIGGMTALVAILAFSGRK